MTQNEIIEMAIQAELNLYVHDLTEKQYIQVIETFAKLVAAKHDPKIAIADAYRAGVDSGIAAEREACAKFFDDNDTLMFWGSQAATHIRARGGEA